MTPRIETRMRRREALRILGGTAAGTLLSPLLFSGRAHAQGPVPRPERLVIVHHSQGTVLPMFVPTGGAEDFELPFLLEPIAPFRDELFVYAGLDNVAARNNVVGNSHHRGNLTLFTGRSFPYQDEARITGGGPSVDQELARRLSGDTPFPRRFVGGALPKGAVRTSDAAALWQGCHTSVRTGDGAVVLPQ